MLPNNEQNSAIESNDDIGGSLRDARTIAGISLEDVSRRTRITKSYLEFIELNQFEKLPGIGYIPGFIRNYCKAISVDPAPYVEAFKAGLPETGAKPEYKFHVQALVPKMAGSMIAMIVVAAALSGYVGWTIIKYKQTDSDIITAQFNQQLPEVVQQPTEQKFASFEPEVSEQGIRSKTLDKPTLATETARVDDAQGNNTALRLSSDGSAFQKRKNTASPAQTADALPKTLQAGEIQNNTADAAQVASRDIAIETKSLMEVNDTAGSTSGAQATTGQISSELVIKATATSWVEIVQADGKVTTSKLMRAGDSLVASIGINLFLSTGNAGGLTLQTSNIEPFAAGHLGEILRDLPLNFDAILMRRDLASY